MAAAATCFLCTFWVMQILEEQHSLYFHLQQQRLIELIRQNKTEEALVFAQEYLAPHGEENDAFLEELGELQTGSQTGRQATTSQTDRKLQSTASLSHGTMFCAHRQSLNFGFSFLSSMLLPIWLRWLCLPILLPVCYAALLLCLQSVRWPCWHLKMPKPVQWVS